MSWPRPFVVGFILLMLFLSLTSNSPGDAREGGTPLHPSAASGPATATIESDGLRKGVKEQIIYDLSLANERLEGEIQKLKQYVLDLRRTAREAGCELRDDSILTLYPELGSEIQGGGGSGSGEEGASSGDAAAAGAEQGEGEALAGTIDAVRSSGGAGGASTVPLSSRRAKVGAKAAITTPTTVSDADAD